MQPGTIVKYSQPEDNEEAAMRFIVVEDRKTRFLVELVCDMPIRPTFVYDVNDLEVA